MALAAWIIVVWFTLTVVLPALAGGGMLIHWWAKNRPKPSPQQPAICRDLTPREAARDAPRGEWRKALSLLVCSGLLLVLGLNLRGEHRRELADQRAREAAQIEAQQAAKERAQRAAAQALEAKKLANRNAIVFRAQFDPNFRGYLSDMSRIREEYNLLAPKDQIEADQLLMKKWGIDQDTLDSAKALNGQLPDLWQP